MWTLDNLEQPDASLRSQVQKAWDQLRQRQDLGYLNPSTLEKSCEECVQNRRFFADRKNLAVIGLGGSSLGTKAFAQALLSPGNYKRIHFLDNIDTQSVDRWLQNTASFEDWSFVVCSKSGGTLEVLALYDYCYSAIKKKHNFSIIEQTAVVTELKNSPLYDFAKTYNCPVLEVPKNVGGRFSVFTPVGLFPLSFFDLDLEAIQKGFIEVLNQVDLVHSLVATLWQSHLRGEQAFYSFQYSDSLYSFGFWLQQLWSESLGKAQTRQGRPAEAVACFVPCRGASDQHSVLQQIMEGPEKKLTGFHQVATSEKGQFLGESQLFPGFVMNHKNLGTLMRVQAEATRQALQESGRSTFVLKTQDLSPESLASLMGLWMLTVGALGELLDIDAFNQPGVESGKKITRRVLAESN